MTATADYGVAIAEDFTPPEKWVPGQPINKDVGATNTGSVDAFVRMYMDGEMRVLKTTAITTADSKDQWNTTNATFTEAIDNAGLNTTRAAGVAASTAKDVEDAALVNMGLTKVYRDDTSKLSYYYKMLSTTSTKNPADNQQSNNQNDYSNQNDTDYYSEVQSVQAGGVLAYAPDDAEYTYILNQETELPIYSKTSAAYSVTKRKVPANTRVYVINSTTWGTGVADWAVDTTADMSAVKTVFVPAQDWTPTDTINEANHFDPVNVDADSFQPLTTGLYLFARNINLDDTATNPNDYEFSGYYYSNVDTVITSADGGVTMTHTIKNTVVPSTGTGAVTTTTDYKDANFATNGKFNAADGDYGKGTYYALKAENDLASGNNRSDYTVANETSNNAVTVTELDNDMYFVAPTDKLELYTANYTTIDSSRLKWFYTADAIDSSGNVANPVLHAWYDADGTATTPDSAAAFNADEDILIDVTLKNVGTGAAQWTVLTAAGENDSANRATGLSSTVIVPADVANVNKAWTFYYNDDLESGDTTERLVDTVTLNQNVTNKAYLAFDFDLNMYLDSVQVTIAEDGKEGDAAVKPWAAAADATRATRIGATGTRDTGTTNEINSMTWVKSTT